MLIFNFSVGHTAETGPVWDIYGNPPNQPFFMREPMRKKG